jgi:hypothetical protein
MVVVVPVHIGHIGPSPHSLSHLLVKVIIVMVIMMILVMAMT